MGVGEGGGGRGNLLQQDRCTLGVRVFFSEQECDLVVVLVWINQNCVVYI